MKITDFDYELPPFFIAQHPLPRRDHSRLCLLSREGRRCEHRVFSDIVDYLSPGDLLILNETKVFPARLIGQKEGTGGRVEILLVRENGVGWEALIRGKVREGERILCPGGGRAEVVCLLTEGKAVVSFSGRGDLYTYLGRWGRTPLPPYIRREENREDRVRYQTVYAKTIGSVAAPTAGLHFTSSLLEKIREKGVIVLSLTLHVGPGTFQPVRVEEIGQHRMHLEYFEVSPQVASCIEEGKRRGRKVIAVGTTTARALESALSPCGWRLSGFTDLFICPGYHFHTVDALLTNFHIPRSTLLMMVSALAGTERVLSAYAEAMRRGYRFLSYGDAMLIV